MILRATFRNILSFKDETQISFVAGKSTTHPSHVVRAEKRDDISVLRSGIVYGANASGKSNFINAVNFLKLMAMGKSPSLAMERFKSVKNEDPFSKIELEIKLGSRYFAYGVEFNFQEIKEEWLYEINNRTERVVFTRVNTDEGVKLEFGEIEGNKETSLFLKFLGESTPSDKTFISEYKKRNGKGLNNVTDVWSWFATSLKIIFPYTRFKGLSIKVEKDASFQSDTKELLKHFNTGITDVRRIRIHSKEETGLPEPVLQGVEKDCNIGENVMVASSDDNKTFFFERQQDGAFKIFKQIAVHGQGEEETKFDMDEESDGTIRFLDFIPMLIDLRHNPAVYLIDELDRSMHPMMTYEILRNVFDHINSEVPSQIIFSTHESNILDLELMRADEIWFVEKDKSGASHFSSLAEYKPRADIRKGYLQGRYGAVPFFASPSALNWNKE